MHDGHSIWNDVVVDRFVFNGHNYPNVNGTQLAWPWVQAITGTPGAIRNNNGVLKIPLAATVEAECNRLYMADLAYRIADLVAARFVVACSAALPAGVGIAFGMAHTPADDPDNINQGVWFRVLAGNTVVCESDDGTTDVDDVATGQSLGLKLRQFVINFRDGVWQGDPRDGGAVGGYKAIQMAMHNASGILIPVAAGTKFTLAAAGGPLQPFLQIFKSSVYTGPNLYVKEIEIEYKRQAYTLSDTVATTTTTTTTTTAGT